MLMHFNDIRMGIEIGVPFYFRDRNSDRSFLKKFFLVSMQINRRWSIIHRKQKIIKRVCLICDVVDWHV